MSRVSRVSRSSIVYVPKVTTRTSISRDYATSSGTLTWESALNDVLPVLKIQYRSDIGVSGFLNDSDKVRQLKFSSIARTEYNRRCIREECDFEMYSPPRARRIAKEVAIDWVRKYLDENDEKLEASIDLTTGDVLLNDTNTSGVSSNYTTYTGSNSSPTYRKRTSIINTRTSISGRRPSMIFKKNGSIQSTKKFFSAVLNVITFNATVDDFCGCLNVD